MSSVERPTELAKALPETELARVIGYIEGLQAMRTRPVSTTGDDRGLFEQCAGSWTGRFQREVLSLPMGPHLDEAQQARGVAAMQSVFESRGPLGSSGPP